MWLLFSFFQLEITNCIISIPSDFKDLIPARIQKQEFNIFEVLTEINHMLLQIIKDFLLY